MSYYCIVTVLIPGQSNIFVDAEGHARITVFGRAAITHSLNYIERTSAGHSHSLQWLAPEILGGWGTYSKEGDIFSLAMVAIEVPCGPSACQTLAHRDSVTTQIFTGTVPFKHSPPTIVMSAILEGKRPSRPGHPTFSDGLWKLTQCCWNQEAHLRPRIPGVLRALRSLYFSPLNQCICWPD